jgi:hypothetical protein
MQRLPIDRRITSTNPRAAAHATAHAAAHAAAHATLLLVLCAANLGPAIAHAATPVADRVVDLHKPADPEGQVEIIDVSGHIEIVGWERPEIAVSGTIGDRVERVDVSTDGDHATVRVVLPALSLSGGSGAAKERGTRLISQCRSGNARFARRAAAAYGQRRDSSPLVARRQRQLG